MDKYAAMHPSSSSSAISHLGLNNMWNTSTSPAYNTDQFQSKNKPNGFLELMANMEVQSTTTAETKNNTAGNIDLVISPDQHHQSTNGFLNDGNDHHQLKSSSSPAAGNYNNKNRGSEKKIRKRRYAFQTRSQVDILDDGYRWRKYGQKAVKSSKFPRSYYKCTHQGCNVKKQVQRLSKDEEIVVTTYEGMHSHPIEKSTDNFDHILSQMQIYTPF